MENNNIFGKNEFRKPFILKLVKYFAFPFLLFFSMQFFPDDVPALMIIGCLIVLYFLIIILIKFIQLVLFLFHIKKLNVFKEGKTLVLQLLAK